MSQRRLVVLAVLIVPFVAACHEDNTLGLGASNGDRFTASLNGANVRPSPVPTSATGTASLTFLEPAIGASQRAVGFTITVANVSEATVVHLHSGGASVSNGPILLTLYSNPLDTTITATTLATGTFAEGAFGAVSLDSLSTLVTAGAVYVDVHSATYPDGLIRGPLIRNGQLAIGDLFSAPLLTGAKERPTPVASTATGAATFKLLANSTMQFNLTVNGLTGATMAHIHTGVVDSAGPIAVTLFSSPTATGLLSGTLASGSFTGAGIQIPGISFDSLLTLMRRGRTYVNVHTIMNPSGEIRAQIDPVSVLP